MTADREASEQVRQLLAELDTSHANALRPALLSLQSMADGEVPSPSAELAALFKADAAPTTSSAFRARHRGLVFSLALIGALAAGAGTAAAVSPDFRLGTAHVIAGIVNALPFGHPTVASPVPSPSPRSTPTPASPGQSGGGTPYSTAVPSDPAHSNGNGNSSSGHANPKSTNHPTPPATPPSKSHDRAP